MTNEKPDGSDFSRRDFLVRAGQFGALSMVAPRFRSILESEAFRGYSSLSGVQEPTSLYAGLHWRHLGPYRGGRVDAVTGVPGRPNEFYYGSVNGGVWKSIDAGRVWSPVFDSQPVASIGALANAPSAPDTLYVGTGESTLRDSMGYGNGVYKTTDTAAKVLGRAPVAYAEWLSRRFANSAPGSPT